MNLSRHRPTVAAVDLRALAHNFHVLKNAVAPGVFFCPMVKANAYGHGDIQVARRLRAEGAEALGVALIEEALGLRASGDRGMILHFGIFDAAGAAELLASDVTPVVSSREGLETLAELAKKRGTPAVFHLEIDTGMSRLGLDGREVSSFAKRVAELRAHVTLAGVATHFADGDDFGEPGGRTDAQLKRFRLAESEIRDAGLSGFKLHVSNSSAVSAVGAFRKKSPGLYAEFGARPGISLYGVEADTKTGAPLGLKSVLRLESRIAHVQDIRQGERVSYGGHWQAARNSKIGVIPCGYGDGYRRGINSIGISRSSKPSVLVNGRRVPITGTICMDYFMCDLTEVEGAGIGSKVTLIGSDGAERITASDVAEWAQTISYEIFTGISGRVPRVYVDGEPSLVVSSKS